MYSRLRAYSLIDSYLIFFSLKLRQQFGQSLGQLRLHPQWRWMATLCNSYRSITLKKKKNMSYAAFCLWAELIYFVRFFSSSRESVVEIHVYLTMRKERTLHQHQLMTERVTVSRQMQEAKVSFFNLSLNRKELSHVKSGSNFKQN